MNLELNTDARDRCGHRVGHVASARRLLVATAMLTTLGSAACDNRSTSAAPQPRTAVDSAEQVMYNTRMILTSNGIRRGEAYGDTVLTFDAGARFDLRPMRIQFSTALGRPLALVTAPGGVYSVPRSLLETRGPVAVTSDTTRRQITTTALRYDPTTNRLETDSAFTATSGTRRMTGVGFTADPGLFSIKCTQRCTGSIGP